MASQVMRITLKAYDHQLVDASAKKIIETVKKNGAKYTKLFINNYETNSFRNFFLNKPYDTSF